MIGESPGPLWTAQQREWLQALGHDVLVLAPAADTPAVRIADPAPTDAARATVGGRDAAMPTPGTHDALLRALARAANRAPHDDEFLRSLPELATLRGDPAARRALWPRLRALRKRRPE